MRRPPSTSRRAAGFTLSEVLIALGILAVGSVAVASLFPSALLLQKQTVDEAIRQNHIRSMDAILLGNGLDNDTLLNFTDVVEANSSPTFARALRGGPSATEVGFDVFALAEVARRVTFPGGPGSTPILDPNANVPQMVGTGYGNPSGTTADEKYRDAETALADFPLSVRCLPTITPQDGTTAGGDPDFSNREVYWVPLIRRGYEASQIYADWSVYVFVFQPDADLRQDDGTGTAAYELSKYQPTSNGANFVATGIICANPFDPGYFPKVFRLPVAWKASDPDVAFTTGFNLFGLVKPGDMVLGDNGKVYKVATVSNNTPSQITLNSQTIYEPLNDRDLSALWIAPATNPAQPSPLAEIRLMSNAVVRVKGPS